MVNWIIEKDIFEENTDALVAACEKYGHKAHIVGYRPFDMEQVFPTFDDTLDPVVFYGSLNLAHKLLNSGNFIGFPGVYYRPKQYNCSTYYAYFGEVHVNGNCAMMPWAEFIRRKGNLPFSEYGTKPSAVFVRPDSGSKLFTGTVVYNDTFDQNIKEITAYSDIEPHDMVLISEPRSVIDEYCFVVIGDEIITGSRYIAEGRLSSYRVDKTHKAWKYAESILKKVKWRPEEIFVLDICKTMCGFEVMEIGCFSCCGLYDCDIDIIVKRVSEEAQKYCDDLVDEICNKAEAVINNG